MTAIPPQTIPAVHADANALETRKPSRRRIVTFLGVLLIAGIVLLPVFVAKSSLRQRILPGLLPDYAGKITTGSASLMWWSPIELADVAFYDPAGEVLMSAEKVTSEKSLATLLLDQIRVGGFYLENPHLKVRLHEGGSNLEDSVRELFAPAEDSRSLDYAIHVRGGRVEVLDPKTGRKTEMRDVGADIRVPRDPAEAVTVRGNARLQNPAGGDAAGTVDFDISYREAVDEQNNPKGIGSLRLKTGDLRLGSLAALIARWNPELELAGVLVSDLAVEWTTGGSLPSFKFDGGLSATNLRMAGPGWMGTDEFRLEFLTQKGRVEYDAGELAFSDFQVKSDVLTSTADGHVSASTILTAWESPRADIPKDKFHLDGEIHVAKIAKMLPHSLKLRKGLEIQTGKLLVALDAKTENAEQILSGKVNTSRIAAIAEGREIVWDRPLELTLKARNTKAGPIVDELACRSDFLTVWAQGGRDHAIVKAACRLDDLMRELGRFAELDSWKLAGRIDAGLTLQRLDENRIRGAASAVVKDFRYTANALKPKSIWAETELNLTAGGTLIWPNDRPRRLENATLRMVSGDDELKITQSEPAEWTGRWPNLRFLAELQGDLRSWRNRLRPVLDIESWQTTGSIVATAQAQMAENQFLIEKAIADFRDLQFKAKGINVSESRARLETVGEWNGETQTFNLPTTTWASPSLAVRADGVVSRIDAKAGPRTSGTLVFRGSLRELSRWFSLESSLGAGRKFAGTASGQIDLTMTEKAADARWNLLIENASLIHIAAVEPPPGFGFRRISNGPATQTQTEWSEDRIALGGRGVYEFSRDRLDLKSLALEAPWISLTAEGSLADLSGRGDANLTGTMTCNLAVLADRLKNRLPESFQIAGRETRPFTVRGPLWGAASGERVSGELTAFAILPCERLEIYGISAGPAEIQAELDRGILKFGPIDAALGAGRFKHDSQIDWNASDLAWRVKKGPLLEDIRFTSDVTEGWIQYALPIIGGSTETEGQFSAALTSDVVVPLSQMRNVDGSARIEIASAQMKPGRLANVLLEATQQIKTLIRGEQAGRVLPAGQSLMRLERQNVDVRFTAGRVHHQKLRIVLAGIPITTSGSVGYDETLALTAEIPIQPDWLTNNRVLGGLGGQTVKIPIGGTLNRPQLDGRAVFSALDQAVRNTTGRILGDEIQNQFERLFNRR